MEKECEKGCPVELGCMYYAHDKKQDCKSWQKTNRQTKEKNSTNNNFESDDTYRVGWTSNSLGMKNLRLISERSSPIIIGVIGLSNSGKTTFLSMIYLMLLSGKKIGDWSFVNSFTLRGWENIINGLKWSPGNIYKFPPHTSVNDGRAHGLLHLSLRLGEKTKDIVFTDVSGEWFLNWAKDKNHENAEGALWIQKNADGFIFLSDSDKLSSDDFLRRAEAIDETEILLDRLTGELQQRPAIFTWAKADKKNLINPSIEERITRKFQKASPSLFEVYDISCYPKSIDDDEYRDNILNVINWILLRILKSESKRIFIPASKSKDLFLNFRGI